MFDAISVEMLNIGNALHRKFSLRFMGAPSCFPVTLQREQLMKLTVCFNSLSPRNQVKNADGNNNVTT